MSKVYMMVTITNRQLRNQFQDLFEKNEMAPVFGALGRGTADSAVLDYFGLEASEKAVYFSIVTERLEASEKAVYFSIVTESMWKQLRRELIIKMQIDVPGTGIAFIVPVSSIGGKKVLQYLIGGQEFEKEEETVLKDTKYELLVAIANQGSIDNVMDAARSANAGGGTVIHAKGTGMEKAEKFLGVSLAEEKEIILIVAKTSQKNEIMKAIMEQAGLESKEKAIVFSLPVTSTVGVRMPEEEFLD